MDDEMRRVGGVTMVLHLKNPTKIGGIKAYFPRVSARLPHHLI